MNRRALIALPAAVVGALALWCSPRVSAPPKAPAPPVPVYNPYPAGILPSNLSSEISRGIREVDVIESRALARWHALQRPILTGQPPVLENTGTEIVETHAQLMLFDKN